MLSILVEFLLKHISSWIHLRHILHQCHSWEPSPYFLYLSRQVLWTQKTWRMSDLSSTWRKSNAFLKNHQQKSHNTCVLLWKLSRTVHTHLSELSQGLPLLGFPIVKGGFGILPQCTPFACILPLKCTLWKSCRNMVHDIQSASWYMQSAWLSWWEKKDFRIGSSR